jgi:hypothetical protein
MEHDTFAKKAERELDDWGDLVKRRPHVAILILVVLLASIGTNFYYKFSGIPALQDKINVLSNANKDLKSDLQLCETKLAPFKTVAVEWYKGSEVEALSKLALRVQEIDSQLKADKDFHEVAQLNLEGNLQLGDLVTTCKASGWGKDCVTIKDKSMDFKCSEECLEQFSRFCETAWWWPYPYLGVAECLKASGNERWEEYANIGLSVLSHMLLVPFRRVEHLQMFDYFKEKYPEVKINRVQIPATSR